LLVQQYTTLQQGRSSIIRLRELLETAPSVDEVPDAADLPTSRAESPLSTWTFAT
jgi:ATP-binding cassette subfamily B protein